MSSQRWGPAKVEQFNIQSPNLRVIKNSHESTLSHSLNCKSLYTNLSWDTVRLKHLKVWIGGLLIKRWPKHSLISNVFIFSRFRMTEYVNIVPEGSLSAFLCLSVEALAPKRLDRFQRHFVRIWGQAGICQWCF